MNPSSLENNSASSCAVVTAYIGNFRSDFVVEVLEEKVQSLFESIGIFLLLQDIRVHHKSPRKPAYCFVNLNDIATFDYVVKKLNGIECFDVFPGKKLVVSAAHRNRPCLGKLKPVKLKSRPSRKTKHTNSHGGMKHSVAMGTNPVVMGTNYMGNNLITMGTNSVAMGTNSIAMGTNSVVMGTNSVAIQSNLIPNCKVKKYDALMDKVCYGVPISNHGNQNPDPSQRHFYVGEKVGTEDRLTEYKQGGGGYLNKHFNSDVGKYVCAFLNSEGGALLIGVQDDCHVCGVMISSHREDHLRLGIDEIMKKFIPPVFPNSYSVKFIPVYAWSPVTLTDNNTRVSKPDPKPGIITSVDSRLVSSSKNYGNSTEKMLTELSSQPDPGILNKPPALNPNSDHLKPSCSNSKSQDDHKMVEGGLSSEKTSFGGQQRSGRVMMNSDLKVIEIAVNQLTYQKGETKPVYENQKGEVYIRRDGSIQGPLKASQILALDKQNITESSNLERDLLQQEIQRKQGEIEMNVKLVDEMVKQKQFLEDQYQEKFEKLKENEDKMNAEINVLRSQEKRMQTEMEQIKRNKSKVCNIM